MSVETALPSSPLPRHLLPDNHEVSQGRLSIGGCDLIELAEVHGTPLFVYDEEHLRSRCREAVDAFGPDVSYAAKAFLCVAMARLVHSEGMGMDVATGGELHVALAAGVPADRLVLHGNNKSMAELRQAIEAGVGRIVVDSFDELDRLDALHAEAGARPRVLLRFTPGVEAHTHTYLVTGADDSKFGFTVSTGAAAAAMERATASSLGRCGRCPLPISAARCSRRRRSRRRRQSSQRRPHRSVCRRYRWVGVSACRMWPASRPRRSPNGARRCARPAGRQE